MFSRIENCLTILHDVISLSHSDICMKNNSSIRNVELKIRKSKNIFKNGSSSACTSGLDANVRLNAGLKSRVPCGLTFINVPEISRISTRRQTDPVCDRFFSHFDS